MCPQCRAIESTDDRGPARWPAGGAGIKVLTDAAPTRRAAAEAQAGDGPQLHVARLPRSSGQVSEMSSSADARRRWETTQLLLLLGRFLLRLRQGFELIRHRCEGLHERIAMLV